MKQRHSFLRSYPLFPAGFCFFVGILAGTLWVNRLGKEAQEQVVTLGQALLAGSREPCQAAQAVSILMKRELPVLLLWLSGMSVLAQAGLWIGGFGLGFFCSFLISCMTLQAGRGGLLLFLLSMFPQCLFFIPVIAALVFWSLEENKRAHLAGFVALLLLTAVGTAVELYVNPWVMGLAGLLLQ